MVDVQGVLGMSRPRSLDPAVRISFSMPRSMILRLDSLLSYNASRSKWITSAIKEKMKSDEDKMSGLDDSTLKDLIGFATSHKYRSQMTDAEWTILDALWRKL